MFPPGLRQESHWLAPAIISVLAVISFNLYFRRRKHHFSVPPGPKALPLIANLLQIPFEEPWLAYYDWAKIYGDIIYLEALGQRILVLNSLEAANEVLVTRALNYSNRCWSPVGDLTRFNWSFSLLNYGQDWRDHRRTFHRVLNHTQVHHYHTIIEQEVAVYLRALLHRPKDFLEITRFLYGTIIMRVSYGVEDFQYNKPLIQIGGEYLKGFMMYASPGRLLVSTFHWLRFVPFWVPGAGWRRTLEDIAQLGDEVHTRPFDDAKQRIKSGPGSSSEEYRNIATQLIEDLPDQDDTQYARRETLARNVSAVAFAAGADTTVTSGHALLLALAMHPEVQRKAQAQIDTVVGADRLPSFQDIEELPYIQAVIKEVGRWHTVLPLGFPRTSNQEDVFRGYRIPANTVILPNTWAIMHDPDRFENPMAFNPDRYIKHGKIDPSVLDPEGGSFGFGRRICPGRHLSNASLTLTAACLLACFEVRPPLDEAGNPVPLKLEVLSSLIAAPLPFDCQIVVRSPRHAALVDRCERQGFMNVE